MITVTYGQNPPCLVLRTTNRDGTDREPCIIWSRDEAERFVLDLTTAYVKAFPQPLKYHKPAEVFDGA